MASKNEATVVALNAVRAPELDAECDSPATRPAWRVTRDGVGICIAEAATEADAILAGIRELRIRREHERQCELGAQRGES